MQVANQFPPPVIAEGAAPLPPPVYEVFMDYLGMKPNSVAKAWLLKEKATDWVRPYR